MSAGRWQSFYEVVADVGVLPKRLDWQKAFDLGFVNKGVGRS
jgi:NitT/TauT family transport system substrate-binding protein